MLYQEEQKDAVQSLTQGATLSMVDKHLQNAGVGSGHRSEILDVARQIVNRRARIKNAMIGGIGLIVLALGGYGLYVCLANQFQANHARLPVIVMIVGLLIALYGSYNATRKCDLSGNRYKLLLLFSFILPVF